MKLTFIRADHEVTGSCTLLEIGGHYGLIDCGMQQGRDQFENIDIPVPAAQIEFSARHARAHGPHRPPARCCISRAFAARSTQRRRRATCAASCCATRRTSRCPRPSGGGARPLAPAAPAPSPLYTLEDAEGVLTLLRPCAYGQRVQVGENIIIRFTDVGHLLGSACIEAWLTEGDVEKKIVFSGDIGNVNQPLLRDPQAVSGADYVLIESTYGDRSHGDRPDYLGALADCIQRTA